MRVHFILTGLFFIGSLQAQIPNASFEQWTNLQPDDWITNSCPLCDPPWESYIVRQDSDAYSGNYNADLYSNGVFKPHAFTQFPITYRPTRLRFYTKILFPLCINDSGGAEDTVTAIAKLLHNGVVVDSGYWSYSGPSILNYQLIEVSITQNAVTFDSCMVYLEGGAVFGGCGIVAEPTRFKVDALELVCDSFICTASFYYTKQIDSVGFYDSSNLDSITTWLWEFGDGASGNTQIATHIYSPDGWYYPCLTVTGVDSSGSNCTATYCDSVLITHGCVDTSQICPPPSLCCDAPIFELVCGCDNVTYDNACQATSWYGVTSYTNGPCITGIGVLPKTLNARLMPNPSHEKAVLSFQLQEQGTIVVRMKNVLGQMIKEYSSVAEQSHLYSQEIELDDCPNGTYFLEVLLNGKIAAVKKLMKE